MVVAAFVAPYLLEATARFVSAAADLPDVRLGLVTCEPVERIPPDLRDRLDGHWRIDDPLDPRQLAWAVDGLAGQIGRGERLGGAPGQLQVPLAQAREALGMEGMDVRTAINVRDKSQMKETLQAAGIPCARHALVHSAGQATAFADQVGFPLVAKPPAGAGAQSTFRLDDGDMLRSWLAAVPLGEDSPPLLEEFLTGEEHTLDSVTPGGAARWASIPGHPPPPPGGP